MSELRDAVKAWIKAEYAFRLCNRTSYTAEAQDRYVEAEERLRKACTGRSGLRRAAKRCGVLVARDLEPPQRTPTPAKIIKQVKMRGSQLDLFGR